MSITENNKIITNNQNSEKTGLNLTSCCDWMERNIININAIAVVSISLIGIFTGIVLVAACQPAYVASPLSMAKYGYTIGSIMVGTGVGGVFLTFFITMQQEDSL